VEAAGESMEEKAQPMDASSNSDDPMQTDDNLLSLPDETATISNTGTANVDETAGEKDIR